MADLFKAEWISERGILENGTWATTIRFDRSDKGFEESVTFGGAAVHQTARLLAE